MESWLRMRWSQKALKLYQGYYMIELVGRIQEGKLSKTHPFSWDTQLTRGTIPDDPMHKSIFESSICILEKCENCLLLEYISLHGSIHPTSLKNLASRWVLLLMSQRLRVDYSSSNTQFKSSCRIRGTSSLSSNYVNKKHRTSPE